MRSDRGRTGWPWLLLALVIAGPACAKAKEHPDAERACELLQTERAVAAPGPEPSGGDVERSLHSVLVDQRVNSAEHGLVFVEPEQAEELDAIAEEVAQLPGIEVAATVDQQATYEEFVAMFPGQSQLIDAVSPMVLPPSVRVRAASDVALDELVSWADGDPRVYEVIDIREVADVMSAMLARRFGAELDELMNVTGGDTSVAFQRLRSADDQPLDVVVATYQTIEEFVADECA